MTVFWVVLVLLLAIAIVVGVVVTITAWGHLTFAREHGRLEAERCYAAARLRSVAAQAMQQMLLEARRASSERRHDADTSS